LAAAASAAIGHAAPRAAEQRDEVAAVHSITSSSRAEPREPGRSTKAKRLRILRF